MLPSVYVSPLKLHSATEINLHGVSGSALFRNQFVFLILSHLYLRTLGVSIEEVQCIPLFLSAMPRDVAVVNIFYVVNQLLNLKLMVDNFL